MTTWKIYNGKDEAVFRRRFS